MFDALPRMPPLSSYSHFAAFCIRWGLPPIRVPFRVKSALQRVVEGKALKTIIPSTHPSASHSRFAIVPDVRARIYLLIRMCAKTSYHLKGEIGAFLAERSGANVRSIYHTRLSVYIIPLKKRGYHQPQGCISLPVYPARVRT